MSDRRGPIDVHGADQRRIVYSASRIDERRLRSQIKNSIEINLFYVYE